MWIAAPASGAVLPCLIVQPRVSLSPVVKKLIKPKSLYAAVIRSLTPSSSTPNSFLNSTLSAASSSDNSCSTLASTSTNSEPELLINSRKRVVSALGAPALPFNTYKIGLTDKRFNCLISGASLSSKLTVLAIWPAKSAFSTRSKAPSSKIASFLFCLTSRAKLARRLVTVCKSAKISSRLIVSTSLIGSKPPET